MTRSYRVVDADGHILEPLSLWQDYMDPAFRERAPRLIRDTDGKERLVVEEQVLDRKLRRLLKSAPETTVRKVMAEGGMNFYKLH